MDDGQLSIFNSWHDDQFWDSDPLDAFFPEVDFREPEPPILPLKLELVTGVKNAKAQVKNNFVTVQIPKWWPKDYRQDVCRQLYQQSLKSFQDAYKEVYRCDEPLISIHNVAQLKEFVEETNSHSLHQYPHPKVKLGNAKYSRMAQMNIRLRQMTVSTYCLRQVPEAALRYLIVHELSHLVLADHSKSFWALVSEFVPDYKKQDRCMKAFHTIRLYQDKGEC
jgi:hypothetical protein